MQLRERRNKDIVELYHRLPIERIAKKHNLSVAHIYRIIKNHEQDK